MNSNICKKMVQQRAHLDYEYQLIKLKRDAYLLQQKIQQKASQALIEKLKADFQHRLGRLRIFFADCPELVLQASSLFAVPTRQLEKDERLIHRIWLGGLPPYEVNQAIAQWFCAIKFVELQGTACFRQLLWIWDAAQLNADDRFIAETGEDPHQLGFIITPEGTMQINALRSLLEAQNGAAKEFVIQLQEMGYYATLSDYFRLLILMHRGGVYMDADTIPYKPVSWFLFKPELPYFTHVPDRGNDPVRLSCLNLFLDETGMIVGAKEDPALKDIFTRLNEAYLALPVHVPKKDAAWERQIFGLFYAIWREHLSYTLISHDDFCSRYAVYTRGVKEAVPCGVRGMRLLEDIITGEKRPLSEEEAESYQLAVNALEAENWMLQDPLELNKYAEVYDLSEHPRIAYALQLRSDIEHFHYYAVLSEDEKLDRVNRLFGRYLLKRNQQAIDSGDFWQRILHRAEGDLFPQEGVTPSSSALIFADGKESTSLEQDRMAKLIFSTSYLEYCSVGNPSGLDIVALQKAQNIEPMLTFNTVMYTPNGEFAGFFISGMMQKLLKQPVPYLYREEIRSLDKHYDDFVASCSHADDYFIGSLALEPSQRGKGYLHQVLREIQYRAWLLGAKRITLCTWERSEARLIWLKQGFRQTATLDSCQPWFGDRVIFMQRPVVAG